MQDDTSSKYRVVPFGNPRIKGHLHLPAAYHVLHRSESQGIRHVPLLTFCLTDHVWSIYTFSF